MDIEYFVLRLDITFPSIWTLLIVLVGFGIAYFWAYNARTGVPRMWDTPTEAKAAFGYRYPFTPFPTGWYLALTSDELRGNQKKKLSLLGRNVTFQRKDNGNVCATECDSEIRQGLVLEKNNIIFLWHQGLNDWLEPFEIPSVQGLLDPDWSMFHLEFTCRVHIQEVAENALDTGHFNIVHAYETKPEIKEFTVEKHKFTVVLSSLRHMLWITDITHLHITYHGMGVVHANVESNFIQLSVILTTTPLDEERCRVRMFIRLRRTWNIPRNIILLWYLPHHIGKDFFCDIPIWENKRYQGKALLCKGDGPINAIRRWAKIFYE